MLFLVLVRCKQIVGISLVIVTRFLNQHHLQQFLIYFGLLFFFLNTNVWIHIFINHIGYRFHDCRRISWNASNPTCQSLIHLFLGSFSVALGYLIESQWKICPFRYCSPVIFLWQHCLKERIDMLRKSSWWSLTINVNDIYTGWKQLVLSDLC